MQLIDTHVITTLLVLVGLAATISVALIATVAYRALSITRSDRVARHESIPTYYGRLHFAS